MPGMNRGRRLRARTDDGGSLLDPSWDQLPALVEANVARRATYDYDVQGKSLDRLSREARACLIDDATAYTQAYRDIEVRNAECGMRNDAPVASFRTPHSELRICLAGHQPELFHPGVWSKNFALAKLAKSVGGVAVNLIIDGDTLKSPSLRVPTGTVDEPRIVAVPFDAATDELPFEDREIVDAELFSSFGRRACEVIRPFVADPLLATFWPAVVEDSVACRTLGECFSRARHRLEGTWGVETLEFPQSRVCEGESFRWFTSHLLAQLPRFHEVHNAALLDYRRVEHIRSANHPVPELERDDDWLEAPLWIWSATAPRRRRVFVRRTPEGLELTDRGSLRLPLPLHDDGNAESAVAALGDLARQGYRLRSRALLTTMYARLVLGDVFLHGIGGGKYDELTDEIIRRFFGLEPPGFGVVTATRRLPIAPPRDDPPDVEQLERRLWELTHHPERFVDPSTLSAQDAEAAARAIAEKRRWTATEPTRENGKERCHAVRGANVALQPWVAQVRLRTLENLETARRRRRAETILHSREFSSFLFPGNDLRDFLLAFPAGAR
jgi:hypothetical protein